MTIFLALTLSACSTSTSINMHAEEPQADTAPKVVGKKVTYQSGDTTLEGYLAYDEAKQGNRPGVLVVHEWWGLNDYARKRADMLAELGYTAFALDMYGQGRHTTHPDDAQKFMEETMSDMPAAQARFMAAYEVLKEHTTTDATKIAAMGYCFGGAVVLHMARAGTDLDGVASFHGNLGTQKPAAPGDIQGKVLVATGAADPFVPEEQVAAFRKEMSEANVDLEFVSYPDVKHSFTNPGATAVGAEAGMPLEYNQEADNDSWARLQRFLHSIFSE